MAESTRTPKQAYLGMDLNSVPSQMKEGSLYYALNAVTEGSFNGNQITYQNEQANEMCTSLPDGYKLIGGVGIIPIDTAIVFLHSASTESSEIGKIVNCEYSTLINAACLNFDIARPIQKIVVRYNGTSYEIYWVEEGNKMRWIDLGNLPFTRVIDGCNTVITDEVDCNRLNIQPEFSIPRFNITSVGNDGEILAGTYQFTGQYANALGEGYTSFYSVTNPLSVFDSFKITQDFNFPVNKSINVSVENIDYTGIFSYLNIAVIKTVNNISSVELVGTFEITGGEYSFTYTGQSKTNISLSIEDIFQKYEIYDSAQGLTTAQDVLIPYGLTATERIAYQEIANQIKLKWQSFRVKGDGFYSLPENTLLYKGYMRDEVYPFEFVPLLKNGKQCDGFYIASRISTPYDEETISNKDTNNQPLPRWRIYNTGSVEGYSPEYTGGPEYTGAYQFGEFSYWESADSIPCNELYGELKETKIRHHKFPDTLISPHFDESGYIYPMGVLIDVQQVYDAIQNSSLTQEQKDNIAGFKIVRGNRAQSKSIKAKGYLRNVGKATTNDQTYYFPNYPYNDLRKDPFISTEQTDNDSGINTDIALDGFSSTESQQRFVLNSPDTSFFQPSLGEYLKLEGELSGTAKAHFVPVQKHSQYKFPSFGAYATGIGVGVGIGVLSGMYGLSNQPFDGAAAFTAYQVFVDIITQTTPKLNYTYQYNSVGDFTILTPVENDGEKIRSLDIGTYLTPGMINVGDTYTINNFQRESSIYLKTSDALPLNSVEDNSRFINSDSDCNGNILEKSISGWYATLKTPFLNQYGQLYSYETVDTGYQKIFGTETSFSTETIFGGDAFINKFSFKTKMPFFIDNRVNAPDEADIDYRDFNNLGYPTYWFSSDADDAGVDVLGVNVPFVPRKINNFDCDTTPFFYQKGKIYIFAYGIPTFWCESEVNVDMRQAFNGTYGDFYPRVSSDIPDNWLQETNTSILYDNSYYYNKTFSKQNKENFFSHLPPDFSETKYSSNYPYRAIFSEPRTDSANPSLRNNWLIFKPSSVFDFPQNYGRLISLDGIENKQVLARFENKSLLYNAMLTAPSSVAQVYLGQTLFNQQVPPLDYADTDAGYAGSQHVMFIKTEYGHITTDSKRGQVFLINGQQIEDLTREHVSKFFIEFFKFEIIKHFPDVDIDNSFNGIGISGTYDTKYDRLILTKLDYKPLLSGIIHENGIFFYNNEPVELTNTDYFCNYCFTISYSFTTKSWVSFHTYLPVFYIPNANFFYSVHNDQIWKHNTTTSTFNNFYGQIAPYIIEYPYSFAPLDQIIQSFTDYTKALKYTDWDELIETDDYFDELILSSNSQCSGILKLISAPKNNLADKIRYPIYNSDNKEILVTKKDTSYRINTFWDLVVLTSKPVWIRSCESLSVFKELNQSNMSYSKRAYKKAPLRSKDLKVRLVLNSKDDVKLLSQFTTLQSQNSII